uniref:Uncharacterized protein n=1 Tax=Magallana gigas TaxID=29159 RepID=K1R7T6_MAGGI
MERTSDKHRKQMIGSYDMIFAVEIVDLLSEIVYEQCYGCSVDHPSHVQHSCIMETPLTHMWMYFDLAVEKVNKEIVKEKWLREIIALNISDSAKVKRDATKWIERHVPNTESWREEVTKMCENMVKFNARDAFV